VLLSDVLLRVLCRTDDLYHELSATHSGPPARDEIGVKYFVAPNLSLDLEAGIQHMSNGGMANRNLGVNAFGAQVRLTYYFPTREW
jgi:hypothetical protein